MSHEDLKSALSFLKNGVAQVGLAVEDLDKDVETS